MNQEPTIQNLPERTVAFVSFTGDFAGKSEVFAELFGKLAKWAQPKGLLNDQTVFLSAYPDDPKVTPPEKMTVDACMAIAAETEVDGEIQKKVLPGGAYVVQHFELAGPSEYGSAWQDVVKWAEAQGHEIDMSRPSYEIYLNNPEEHPEKHHILDICLSVVPK